MTDWFRVDFGITQGRGDPDFSNLRQLRIEARGTGETDIRYWIDDIRMTPGVGESYAILVFYGALDSHYEEAFPILKERGWLGTVAASSTTIGSTSRLGLDEFEELRDAGWDVCSLPWPGRSFQEMDPEDQ